MIITRETSAILSQPQYDNLMALYHIDKYPKICNIRRTKSQNFNVSRLVLQLYMPDHLKPRVKSRMKM